MDKLKKLLKHALCIIIIISNLTQCQNTKEVNKKFYIKSASPDDVAMCSVLPLEAVVYTLEGEASFPFGSSGGRWGESGKGEGAQWGTPIGAKITYYAEFEGKFYHIDFRMPQDSILNYMERAYPRWDDLEAPTQEYKNIGRGFEARTDGGVYESFSDLIFGFAPEGMLVVWLRFGTTQIEVGRYQATVITDPAAIEKNRLKVVAFYGCHESYFYVAQKENYNPNLSSKPWDNYRTRYSWRPVIVSEDPKHRLMETIFYYYNGETEMAFRPYVTTPTHRQRALPKELVVFWETGKTKNEKFQARAFFNWEKANEIFQQAGSNSDLEIKITNNNTTIELYLNGTPIPTDSTRVYLWEGEYRDSY